MLSYNPREVQLFRRQKAAFFRRDDHSPLQGDDVEGLRYFSVSNDFVFTASLNILDLDQRVWLATSTGDSEPYNRYALAVFTYQQKTHSLTLFRPEGSQDSNRLFIPFNDESNSKESYTAGRYLEVSPDATSVTLDFNYAYNPYCAYSERFRCPIPPAENRLEFAVYAGEKNYDRVS